MKNFIICLLLLASFEHAQAADDQHCGGMRARMGSELFGQFKDELTTAHQVHEKIIEVSPSQSYRRSDFLFILSQVRGGYLAVYDITAAMFQDDADQDDAED